MSTLHETAARLGAHQWFEQSVWRVLGAWAVPMAAEAPAAAVLMDRHAQHASWRAQQWWERLPVLAGIERGALVRPTPSAAAMVGRADDPAFPATPAARLAASYRVLLPRLVASYGREARLLSEVSDGPALRTLAQVSADAAADWQAGESFLQTFLVEPVAIDQAADVVARLERSAAGHPAGEAAQ